MTKLTAAQAQLASLVTRQYDETTNPLFLWEAYVYARQHQLPVDSVVLEYLDGCAARLLAIDGKGTKDADIARALKLKPGGAGNAFARRAAYLRDAEIVADAFVHKKTLTRAVADAGRAPSEFSRKRSRPGVRKRKKKVR